MESFTILLISKVLGIFVNLKHFLGTAVLSFTLIACSSVKHQSEGIDSNAFKISDSSPELAPREIDKRLSERVQDAQLKGKDAVEFLASELYLKASDASLRGETEISVIHFKHLLALKGEDLFIKKKYAAELIRFGRLNEAERVLAQVFKVKKDDSVGLVLGGIYTALNENKKAQDIYEQLLKSDNQNEEACVLLGKSFFMQKKATEALSTLDTCEKTIKKNWFFGYYCG